MITNESEALTWLRAQPGVDAKALERLSLLVRLLTEENRLQNLVASASLAAVWQRHICDSAQLLRFVPRGTTPWLDLGTGAGFPGLVIACLNPDAQVVLVESRGRRVDWLERASERLSLRHVRIAGDRLERVQPFAAAAISARAFAPLPRLIELAAPFSTRDTVWLLPKGRSAAQELQELSGWRHLFHVEQSLTDPAAGIIVGTLMGQAR